MPGLKFITAMVPEIFKNTKIWEVCEVPPLLKSGHILIVLKSLYFLCQILINARTSFYFPEVIMLKRWWFTMIHPLRITMRC